MLVSGRFPELEDALVERVLELRRGRPLAPLTIVVGSAAVRTRVNDLLVRRLEAVANVSVVTLARFPADLLAMSGGAPPTALTDQARERLVRRLVTAGSRGGLAYFGPVSDRPHFAQALAATFADLREALVPPDRRWTAALVARQPEGGFSRRKATDLQVLYAAYCEELERRGLFDQARMLLDAARAVDAGSVPGKTILYGIYDLNRAQEAFARSLLARGADLLVPIPRTGDRTVATALEAALELGLVERRLDPPAIADDVGWVAAVSRASQASTDLTVELTGDGTFHVVSVADEREEIREAARALLVAAGDGAAFRDCAVVVPHGDDVGRVAAGLDAAGIPVAARRVDTSQGPRALSRLADCLAPAVGEPFERRAVLELLAAAPLRARQVPPRARALWLDEARQAGVIGGLSQWTERLGRRRRGLERRLAELEAVGEEGVADDEEAGETLERVRVRLAAARGLEAALGVLARACGRLPARASWGTWAQRLGEVADALFEPSAAAAVGDAAGRLRALDVLDEEVVVAEMADVVREQLGGAGVQSGRVGRDGVAVLTPLEMRGLRFHSVVFTGLAEGGFPVRVRSDPILGDGPRRAVAEALGTRLPLAESRADESMLLFAFVCEAARERLTLLAPRTDAATGRPRLPSRVLLRLASLAAGRPVGLDELLRGVPLGAVWRRGRGAYRYREDADVVWVDARERDTAVLLGLSERGSLSAAREYLAEILGGSAAADRRLGQWHGAWRRAPGAWDGLLGGQARAALAARHPFAAEMHPTRLERYVACPFAFLLRDVLELDAPEEPGQSLEMDPREFGQLAHVILQRTYETVIAEEPGLEAALEALTAAWKVSCAEAERRGLTGVELAWEVRRGILLEDLRETVRRDPVFARGEGRPIAVEWRFGEDVGRPVTLDLPGRRRIRFAGRLDRLDATPAGARVVDYKTGRGSSEQARLKDGLSVQLPVYQLAVRQSGGGAYGEIACLYRLVTRRGGFEELPLPDDEPAAGARLRALITEAVELIDAGMFPRSPAGRCEYCDVRYACGETAWTRARKREHEALADVVRLQRSGPRQEDVRDGA